MSYAGLAFDGIVSVLLNYCYDCRRGFGSLAADGAGG